MSQVRESYGFPLSVQIRTDVGRVRTNNEDSNGHAWLDDGSLFVMVADGMGGHEAGEVASGLAVQVVEEMVSRKPEDDPRERLYQALLEANSAILEEGRRSGKEGMGTTSVCAVVRGREAHVALVGDSRCYHIRKGHLVWRTIDHTRVQMLIDQGEIDEAQARVHPEAGMLTRALGHGRMADGRPLVPDVLSEPLMLEEADSLVFCSDGMHDLIEDWEVGQLVAGKTPEEAAQGLVNLACERGGHDNVTVAVVTAGKKAGAFDPAFVVPANPDAETTYPGWTIGENVEADTTDENGGLIPGPGTTGRFQPAESAADQNASKAGGKTWILLAAVAVIALLGLGAVVVAVAVGVGLGLLG